MESMVCLLEACNQFNYLSAVVYCAKDSCLNRGVFSSDSTGFTCELCVILADLSVVYLTSKYKHMQPLTIILLYIP